MVDYIADYLQNIRSRRVFPNVQPGYMRELVPDSAPENGEPWEAIFGDIERVVMPGVFPPFSSILYHPPHSFFCIKISMCLLMVSGNALAKSTHACLLSGSQLVPIFTG